MTSCAATAAAAAATKRALNVQAATQHAANAAADISAASKHGNAASIAPATDASISSGAHAAILGLRPGGA